MQQVCADKIESKELGGLPTIGAGVVLTQGSEYVVQNGFLSWIVMWGREFVFIQMNKRLSTSDLSDWFLRGTRVKVREAS